MINYVNFDKFNNDSIDKQLTLTFSGGDVLTNTNLEQESFELTESICTDNQLEFGSCEASMLRFTVWGIFTSHVGQTVTVTMTLDGDTAHPFTIGTYKVVQDTATADRTKRTMTCYDALYEVLNADVATWYNTLYPNTSTTKTVKQIRDSFFSHFGIAQESVTLINDSVSVGKTISPTVLSGKDVIKSICQLNGVFGHITRDNKFRYVSLQEIVEGKLYPEDTLYPADNLYPKDDSGVYPIGEDGNYISVDYQDYVTEKIDKVVIRQQSNDIGAIVGSGTNAYIVEGNFLVYGKNATALTSIGTALLNKIKDIWYRPCEVEVRGNLCFEVGDGIKVVSKYDAVCSIILQRIFRGIQAPRDTFIAEGLEKRNDQVNSVNSELIQLAGKTAVIQKNVDEVSATLTEQLDDSVVGSYAYQTAQEIGLKVSQSDIVDDLNDAMSSSITIASNRITIGSTGALVINTSNFKLTSGGSVTMSGTVNASSGSIGGFDITSDEIKRDDATVDYYNPGICIKSDSYRGAYALAIGYTDPTQKDQAHFKVDSGGDLNCYNGSITYLDSYFITDYNGANTLATRWKTKGSVSDSEYILTGYEPHG